MPFSFERKPRMAGTARACRAIVAAREDGRSLEVGVQPFEAHDTALANLDARLERRPPPADALEALPGSPRA